MARTITEKEKREFDLFMEGLKAEGFEVEVVPSYKEAIRRKCGNGFYRTTKEALSKFKHRNYRLVFQEGKPAAWPSEVNSGYVVINLATPFRLTELIAESIKAALAKDGALV